MQKLWQEASKTNKKLLIGYPGLLCLEDLHQILITTIYQVGLSKTLTISWVN